jgi:hypothetical protein
LHSSNHEARSHPLREKFFSLLERFCEDKHLLFLLTTDLKIRLGRLSQALAQRCNVSIQMSVDSTAVAEDGQLSQEEEEEAGITSTCWRTTCCFSL